MSSILSRIVSFVLFLSSIGFSTAQANASTLISSSTTCGAQCQYLAAAGYTFETQAHASADDPFYTVPSNFSSSLKPGTLLHIEYATNLTNYTVPSGLTMSRIIYTTENLNGTILPASAYILWPYTSKREYSMVAWAHGTTGVFKRCNPSNYRNLQYHFMVPFALALQGMAVVAPDYAGLGFDTLPSGQHFTHAWGLFPAAALDIAHAVTAARAAFPQQLPPKGPFVAMGHSQGGGSIKAFTERQAAVPLAGYKGTVALAPLSNVVPTVEAALANPTLPWAPNVIGLQPKLASSITALFPAYNFSGLTPLSRDRWLNVMAPLEVCLPTDVLVFADVPPAQLANPGWLKDPTVQRYAERARIGNKKFAGPLLMLAGELDHAVALELVKADVNETCTLNKQQKWNQSLEMITFEGVDHFPVIQASQSVWMQWIKDRLAGKAVNGNGCQSSVVKGFRTEDTVQSTAPNFLLDKAGAQQTFEYVL